MKRLVLILFVVLAINSSAQTQQEIIQAYRNGQLSQEQVDVIRDKVSQQTSQKQLQEELKINRMRTVNSPSKNKNQSKGQFAEQLKGLSNGQINNQTQMLFQPVNQPGNNTVNNGEELAVKPQTLYDSLQVYGLDSLVTLRLQAQKEKNRKKIFGHDLFTNRQLTFEPNLNIATPTNYLLGPGDELIIDVWGDSQMTVNEIISPDGKINIAGVGLVSVSGLTVNEATQRLRRQLATIYEGLNTGTVQMKVSLGSIRSILVNIAGEVKAPGTYTLPSLASLFHALYAAGGVNELGSVRSIKLYRKSKLLSEIDVYDYILNGNTSQDISLQEGDLIVVPPYDKLVEVTGEIKRPMFYELKGKESVADVVKFSGGFKNGANASMVSVTRNQGGGEYNDFTIDKADYASFVLEDGDIFFVNGNIDRYQNRVEVQGAVYHEGYYAIDDKVKTVKELIIRAGGLRSDAFMARAILYREKPDWTMEVKAIDLTSLMSGMAADIELRANDMLVVSSVTDVQEEYNVTILGSVKNPATYSYADNMTVEDLVIAAGGLLESAATANVTITRRIKDPKSVQVGEQLFEIFTIELSDGLVANQDDKGFILKPFDQIYVRRSPVYVTQGSVTVKGEVTFEGNYPLSHRNMRLSEVMQAAGGATSGAYLEGAYLLRKMTEEEMMQKKALQQMLDAQERRSRQTENGAEVMQLDSVVLEEVYTVGIRMDKALENPYSDFDIVLRNDDVICIPEYNGTTRVMGAVLYPNTVTYSEGMNVKQYVKSAGGFDNNARRRRAFVIHINGMVESGLRADVRPGSIIVVPSKAYDGGFKWSDFQHGLQSTASLMAILVSTMNLAKYSK